MPKMVFYIFASIKRIEMPFLVLLSAIRFLYTEEIMADTKNDSDNQILIDLVKNYNIFLEYNASCSFGVCFCIRISLDATSVLKIQCIVAY